MTGLRPRTEPVRPIPCYVLRTLPGLDSFTFPLAHPSPLTGIVQIMFLDDGLVASQTPWALELGCCRLLVLQTLRTVNGIYPYPYSNMLSCPVLYKSSTLLLPRRMNAHYGLQYYCTLPLEDEGPVLRDLADLVNS